MRLPKLHVINLNGKIDIYKQLLLEECLLRTTQKNYLIFNRIKNARPHIILGRGNKINDVVNVNATPKIPIIRRFTGGGTVYTDQNSQYVSFIFNTNDINIDPYPVPMMKWTANIYKKILENDICNEKFILNENDYCLNHLKFAGNAQSITRNRLIHHTSFLWKYSITEMNKYLTIPSKIPKYRENRQHDDFLCQLYPYYNQAFGPFDNLDACITHFNDKLINIALTTYFQIQIEEQDQFKNIDKFIANKKFRIGTKYI